MLTADILKASPVLAAITEEQIAAITELSKNDENAVIARKLGEVHGQYDRDIKEATGIEKPAGVKTYDWMKSTILPKVKEVTELETKLATAKTDYEALELKLKDGKVDEAIKQKLTDAETLVTTLKGQLETAATEHKTALEKLQNTNADILVNNEFDKALAGQKFKDENIISKQVRDSFINNAKSAIKAEFKTDWIDDGNGGKQLVFRNAEGEIHRNKDNGLNPFTAQELFMSKIGDVLEVGKKQAGAGTGAGAAGGAGGAGATLDLSGAKTQVEADEIATKYLMDKGVARGTDGFQTEFTKIRDENKVADLPLR